MLVIICVFNNINYSFIKLSFDYENDILKKRCWVESIVDYI